jgi:hypothetical protein
MSIRHLHHRHPNSQGRMGDQIPEQQRAKMPLRIRCIWAALVIKAVIFIFLPQPVQVRGSTS